MSSSPWKRNGEGDTDVATPLESGGVKIRSSVSPPTQHPSKRRPLRVSAPLLLQPHPLYPGVWQFNWRVADRYGPAWVRIRVRVVDRWRAAPASGPVPTAFRNHFTEASSSLAAPRPTACITPNLNWERASPFSAISISCRDVGRVSESGDCAITRRPPIINRHNPRRQQRMADFYMGGARVSNRISHLYPTRDSGFTTEAQG